jgi:phasin family protein
MDMTNPFLAFANLDSSKFDPMSYFKNLSVPGVDVQLLVDSQRKNLEALAAANKQVFEGIQAVAKRQQEFMAQSLSEAQRAAADLGGSQGPRDLAIKQTELLKQGFDKAFANMRELAELVWQSNAQAVSTINQRVSASLDEMKAMSLKP